MDPIVTLSQHSIVTLEYLATAAFAISGVLGALRKRMDIVGICVCGFLALSIICATLISRARLECSERWLQAPDTIGLGLFCATGTHLSWIMPQLFHDHRPYAIMDVDDRLRVGDDRTTRNRDSLRLQAAHQKRLTLIGCWRHT